MKKIIIGLFTLSSISAFAHCEVWGKALTGNVITRTTGIGFGDNVIDSEYDLQSCVKRAHDLLGTKQEMQIPNFWGAFDGKKSASLIVIQSGYKYIDETGLAASGVVHTDRL